MHMLHIRLGDLATVPTQAPQPAAAQRFNYMLARPHLWLGCCSSLCKKTTGKPVGAPGF